MKHAVSKAILAVTVVLALTGCGPSMAQIEAEKSFYQAQMAAREQQQAVPLVEFVPNAPGEPIVITGGSVRVYQPVTGTSVAEIKQYQHQDYGAKWVGLIGQAVSVAAPWVGVGVLAHEMAKMGNTNQTISGTGNAGGIESKMTTNTAPPTVVEKDLMVLEKEIPVFLPVAP